MDIKAGISYSASTGENHEGRYRYLIVAVIWITFFFGGFDRTVISLLMVDHGFLRDMGLEGSPERQGLLMTFLLLPYALSNILLGPAADRWGSRKVLTIMTVLWSVAAFWMGAISSYYLMLIGRVVRGTAEGPLFPVANRYIRCWFPTSERGGANAIWTSGNRVGMALAVPLLALAIGMWGWRSALFLQAVFILILVVPAVWFLTVDTPADMVKMKARERDYINQGQADGVAGSERDDGGLSSLLHNYRFWLMVTYHFAVLATFSGLITWLPKYLRDERGFEVGQMVLFASLPSLGSFLSSLVFGFLSDRIGHHATLCTISLAGASVSIGFSALASSPIMSAWLLVLGMIMWGMGTPIYYAIMQRIVPTSIMATGIGIDNGLANFGAAMAPAVIGFLIAATGTYLAGLLFLAALGLIGATGVAVLAFQKY
jgi:ACS family glucarate transporter-like MFS transporter